MMEYLIWALILIGWVYLITESLIFAPVRMKVSKLSSLAEMLVYCPPCTGFWIGALLALTGWWPHGVALTPFHFWSDAWSFADYWPVGESAIAAMGVAATWSKLTGGNFAYEHENAIRRGEQDDTTSPSEEGKGS